MPARPNILFLCSDQHQADALGAAGHPDVRTPNLDRLANASTRFRRAYCQSPVCVASRGSIVTGRYPHTHGALLLEDPLPEKSYTVAHHFAAHGYQTAAIGKMHFVDESLRHGYEVRVHEGDFAATRSAEQREAFRADQEEAGSVDGKPSRLDEDAFFDTFVAERTVRYLREERDRAKPFLLWSSFFNPHTPLVPVQRYWDLYEPGKLQLPNRCENDLRDGFEGHLIRARERGWYEQPEDALRRSLAGYYGCVSQMDACVGRVLDALRELNLEDDTIVVYTSDHGEMAGAHHMWTKHVMYDEAVRVPLLLRVPGKRTRPQAGALVEQVDLFPTLAELAGLSAPEAIEGKSFASLLRDDAAPDRHRTEAYSEYYFHPKAFTKDNRFVGKPPLLMVRDERWKLCYLDWDRCELYDLAEDPHERTNRIDDPQCCAKADELKAIARKRFAS